MHNLLRQFAAEKLETLDPTHQVQAQHTTYFLRYVQQRETQLFKQDPTQAITDIQAVFDNVRKAWRRAAETNSWEPFLAAAPGLIQFCELKNFR